MFWYYMIPGTFIAYFSAMFILIAFFKKLGMYDD
jgi:hypothetical protein